MTFLFWSSVRSSRWMVTDNVLKLIKHTHTHTTQVQLTLMSKHYFMFCQRHVTNSQKAIPNLHTSLKQMSAEFLQTYRSYCKDYMKNWGKCFCFLILILISSSEDMFGCVVAGIGMAGRVRIRDLLTPLPSSTTEIFALKGFVSRLVSFEIQCDSFCETPRLF